MLHLRRAALCVVLVRLVSYLSASKTQWRMLSSPLYPKRQCALGYGSRHACRTSCFASGRSSRLPYHNPDQIDCGEGAARDVSRHGIYGAAQDRGPGARVCGPRGCRRGGNGGDDGAGMPPVDPLTPHAFTCLDPLSLPFAGRASTELAPAAIVFIVLFWLDFREVS